MSRLRILNAADGQDLTLLWRARGVRAPPKPYASIFSLVAAVAVGLIALQIMRWLDFLPSMQDQRAPSRPLVNRRWLARTFDR